MHKTVKRNFSLAQNSLWRIEINVATALDVDPSQLSSYTFAGRIYRYTGSDEHYSFTTINLADSILTAELSAAASQVIPLNKYQYQITATKAPDTLILMRGLLTITSELVTVPIGSTAPSTMSTMLNKTVIDPNVNIYAKTEVDTRINEAVANGAASWHTATW